MTNLFTSDGRRLQAVEAGSAYLSPDGRLVNVASNMGVLFSDDFGGSAVDAARWDVLDGGLGAVTQSSGPQAAIGAGVTGITDAVSGSNLVVSMGTTNSAERWYLSKQIFAGAEDLTFTFQKSQALAANGIFVGLVEVDIATGYPILNPNLAGDFTNRGGLELGLTTNVQTTILQAVADSSGSVAGVSGNIATLTSNVEIMLEFHAEDIICTTTTVDSVVGKGAVTTRVSSQCPNDGKAYKLLLRFKNVSAPGSNTNVTLGRVLVVDSQENRVEVTSGRGDSTLQKSIPVNLVGASSSLVTGTSSLSVQGAFASNAAGSPNPVLTGAVGESAARAVGTAARTANLAQTLEGQLMVRTGGHPGGQDFGKVAITATTETSLIAAVASNRHELQSLTVANRDNVSHTVDFRDATAGTIRQVLVVPAGDTKQLIFPHRLPAAAVNTAWTAQLRESATTAVEISYASYRTTA